MSLLMHMIIDGINSMHSGVLIQISVIWVDDIVFLLYLLLINSFLLPTYSDKITNLEKIVILITIRK